MKCEPATLERGPRNIAIEALLLLTMEDAGLVLRLPAARVQIEEDGEPAAGFCGVLARNRPCPKLLVEVGEHRANLGAKTRLELLEIRIPVVRQREGRAGDRLRGER